MGDNIANHVLGGDKAHDIPLTGDGQMVELLEAQLTHDAVGLGKLVDRDDRPGHQGADRCLGWY